jgi:hypothetical protein
MKKPANSNLNLLEIKKAWFAKNVRELNIIGIRAYGNTSANSANLEPLFAVAQ